jgi:serine/threonine protein phosphatase PrpC
MTVEIGLEFSEGRAIIADGVGAHAGGALVAHQPVARLGQSDALFHP